MKVYCTSGKHDYVDASVFIRRDLLREALSKNLVSPLFVLMCTFFDRGAPQTVHSPGVSERYGDGI